MSPWQDEELFTLYVPYSLTTCVILNLSRLNKSHSPILEENKQRFETLLAVQTLMAEVGPCPGDILTALRNPKRFKNDIRAAVDKGFHHITTLIREPIPFSNELSHRIILVQRLGPVLNTHYSDEYYVCLKTRDIHEQVMDKFNALDITEAKQLFRACACMGPKGAVFAGNLFEGLAIRYTSVETNDPSVFGLFAQMHAAQSTHQKFPIRYIYQKPGHEWTIIVDSGRVILKGSPIQSAQLFFPSSTMPWSPRKRVEYHDVALVFFNDTSYYCPRASNNPLFDAFFFQTSLDTIILWVLQITIKRDHDAAKTGFGIIGQVKQRAQSVWSSLNFMIKYVLLVPHKEPGLDVEWNFDSDFCKYPGEVFIQELNLGVLGQGFKVEDILGEKIL
jgi:hypothetical protein